MGRRAKKIALDPMGQQRANANRRLRESVYRCPVAAFLASNPDPSIARRLVEAGFSPRELLTRIEPFGDSPPFPMWRLVLLRIIHNRPMAALEELNNGE